ncbi:MAG: hypothetical protein R2724_17305 [Bryobacterales bacterium]
MGSFPRVLLWMWSHAPTPGLRERFEFMVCGEHVRHKPDPEPYHLALER